MKILLLSPPFTLDKNDKQRIPVTPPLGLGYLAGMLEYHGYEVKIIDCLVEGYETPTETKDGRIRYGLSDDQIKTELINYQPDIIGIACVLSNLHYEVCHLTEVCKETMQDIPVVVGGGHPTIMPEKVMEDSQADFIIIGEGEYSFLDLVSHINFGDTDYSNIDGLVYRTANGYKKNKKTKYIENLDLLPFPAWHLLNIKKYNKLYLPHGEYKRKPYIPLITSRGCPADCIFCASKNIWGQKYRARSAENVLAELRYVIKEFGIKEIHFEDDNLTLNKKRALGILNGMIDEGMDLTWTSPNGLAVFALDEDIIEKMKKSGGFSFSIAIESGNQDVLTNIVKKPLKLDRVKEIVKIMREKDMRVRGFFILGFPGETKEQIMDTLDYAENLGLDWVALTIATPLPGSEMYDQCVEDNIIDPNDLDFSKLKYGYANINTSEFTSEEIRNLISDANLRLNFHNNYNMRTGNYERAIIDFERVAHLYPKFELAREYLNFARESLKRTN